MRIADTSALYALFNENDKHHEEAKKNFEESDPIIIPSEIWSETISLIHYRQGKEDAVKAGKALLDLPHVDLKTANIDLLRSSWETFMDSDKDLSFPDSVVVSWCEDKNATPLSFDEGLNSSTET
ncbi:MAG: PIN domain-containing protein [Candidatus Thermoplasmatota archaeon]|nr:PIN domain-containing protein [Candidatus Thermoplasmatota archaeon]